MRVLLWSAANMLYLLMTIPVVAILLIIERMFHMGRIGRLVLILIMLAWGLWDAVQSVQTYPEHPVVMFLWSLTNSLLPLGLWLWISPWMREAALRRERNANQ